MSQLFEAHFNYFSKSTTVDPTERPYRMGISTPKSSSVAEGLHGFHLHMSGFELRTFSEVPNKGLSIPISRREIDGYKVPSPYTINFLQVLYSKLIR
jgi:hypothetical protein